MCLNGFIQEYSMSMPLHLFFLYISFFLVRFPRYFLLLNLEGCLKTLYVPCSLNHCVSIMVTLALISSGILWSRDSVLPSPKSDLPVFNHVGDGQLLGYTNLGRESDVLTILEAVFIFIIINIFIKYQITIK